MSDFKICIGLYRVEGLLGGDLRSLLDVVREADQAGIHQVIFPDHVVMGEKLEAYPYGEYRLPLDEPWYEPMTMMTAAASVTQRLRVSTGILISPLRPPALLAKQVATLDVLSDGRLDLGPVLPRVRHLVLAGTAADDLSLWSALCRVRVDLGDTFGWVLLQRHAGLQWLDTQGLR